VRTFQKLNDWLAQAEESLAAGTYGASAAPASKVTLKTRLREYLVDPGYTSDDIYNHYPCQYHQFGRLRMATLKVVRDPGDNDLGANEARLLESLRRGWVSRKFTPYLPHPLEAFSYQGANFHHQALVLDAETGWYSLEDIRRAYPSGIDPKDVAWIFRRLLVIIGYAHIRGVLHLAVLPRNIWIHPEEHGLQLRNWARAMDRYRDPNRPLPRIAKEDEIWYPDGIWSGVSYHSDIVMAARCMVYLLGGETHTNTLPTTVPQPITAFLRGCRLAGPGAPNNAWKLKDEFDVLLGDIWGERVFHPFTMPTQFKSKEVHNG
jgi:hypothetical protein